MAQRGIELSHQTVSNWANAVGIEVALSFRHRRMGKAGNKWHADATALGKIFSQQSLAAETWLRQKLQIPMDEPYKS